MKFILIGLLVIICNISFGQNFKLRATTSDSLLYSAKFAREFYHQDSVQLVLYPNGSVRQYTWENHKAKTTLIGTYASKKDEIFIKNSYVKSNGFLISIKNLDLDTTSAGGCLMLYDLNGNRLTNYFIEFEDEISFLGLETSIPFDSVKTNKKVRICSNNGAVCSNWIQLPYKKKYRLIANINFDANDYYWTVESIILKKLDRHTINIVGINYAK